MSNMLYQQIEMLSREKHIEPDVVVAAIEDAMVVAARKYYKTEENLRAKFNPETGQVDVNSVRTVVEDVTDPKLEISVAEARKSNPSAEIGSEILSARPTDVLGRIAAQTAKQVILQKVREAERDTIFNEYHNRVGELVTCIVKRSEGPDLIVDMGRTEARLPKREQSRLETYNMGDRVRVVIRIVDRAAKGPQVVVSRADSMLVQRLFEMEVPEIYDGTVQIRAAAREAGERTKIAVASRDKDVDPVGACVGMKGMRVQSIIRELRGEKIDIIPYNEETVAFAQKALSPAKVTRVQIVDPESRKLEVIVEDSQLSLAIGKKGQNVRLASKLIGWDIDIKSEEEKRREIEEQMTALTAPATPLTALPGVGPKTIEKIEAAGITSVEKLAGMTPEQLMEIPGIGEKMVDKIYQAVNRFYEAGGEAPAEGATPEAAAVEGAAEESGTAADETAAAAETASETAEATQSAEDKTPATEQVASPEPSSAAADETAAAAETASETAEATQSAEDKTPATEQVASPEPSSVSSEATPGADAESASETQQVKNSEETEERQTPKGA
ncbi:MAG: transcription termination factor NusA [Acidobacteria bacterium 13_1_40CM_4_61_5]|nr:MAG: transcription termination factor NusA [Acidobacteria bacterium 13_1_40CM_4_61_5]OLE86208.1 MAG: transcription termination factor NusA [Acidobacteria bacterium 13_1_20CM_2_60_10]